MSADRAVLQNSLSWSQTFCLAPRRKALSLMCLALVSVTAATRVQGWLACRCIAQLDVVTAAYVHRSHCGPGSRISLEPQTLQANSDIQGFGFNEVAGTRHEDIPQALVKNTSAGCGESIQRKHDER